MNGMEGSEVMVAKEYIPPTIREQLLTRREGLMREVTAIDQAVKLLDENPAYEKIHDAIVRTNNGRLR